MTATKNAFAEYYARAARLTLAECESASVLIASASKQELQETLKEIGFRHPVSASRVAMAKQLLGVIIARRNVYIRAQLL
jgi:hypothetical protein